MNKTIENKIRLRVVFVYMVLAIVCGGIVYYIYNFRRGVNEQKRNVNQYNQEFVLTNNLISNVQQAQSVANLYKFSGNRKYYELFRLLQNKIKFQIDSLSLYSDNIDESSVLYEIDSLLAIKGEIVQQLTKQFSKYNLLEPLYEKLQTYDTVSVSENRLIVTSVRKDTIINPPPKRNVWRRIGDVFAPKKIIDTTLLVSQVKVDTLVDIMSDTLNIISDIKEVSQEVNKNYIKRINAIERQTNILIASDQEISTQISDLLIQIHEQTLKSMLSEIQRSESVLDKNYRLSIVAAVVILLLMLVFIFLIISDVNKGYAARKALEEANKRTEEIMQSRHALLLSVSHDIKTPLSSIIGYLDLWDDEELPPDTHKKIKSMQNSGKHILSLLTNLLEFSRLEQQKQQLLNTNFDVLELLQEIVEMFEPLALQKKLSFSYQYNVEENRYIRTDYLKLKQILINVLSNAVKYTSEGGIDFIVSEQSNRLFFRINDTGIGIPKKKVESLFKPFIRFGNQSNIEGNGLGMYVVKGLLNLLKGTITVDSDLNKGTKINIGIPVEKIRKELIEEKSSNKILETTHELKILAVDDDESLLTVLGKMLSKLGHSVVVCKNIDDFERQFIHIRDFDIVLTDMDMGTFTGKDILKRVRENNKDIPVIIMTAKGDFNNEDARNFGFSAYLEKPFSLASLSHIVGKNENARSVQSDFPVLYEMFEGDVESIVEILKAFVDSTTENIFCLEQILTENNFEQAQAVCHKMLPMFLQLGEQELAATLKKMDNLRGQSPDKYLQWKTDILNFITQAKLLIKSITLKYLN